MAGWLPPLRIFNRPSQASLSPKSQVAEGLSSGSANQLLRYELWQVPSAFVYFVNNYQPIRSCSQHHSSLGCCCPHKRPECCTVIIQTSFVSVVSETFPFHWLQGCFRLLAPIFSGGFWITIQLNSCLCSELKDECSIGSHGVSTSALTPMASVRKHFSREETHSVPQLLVCFDIDH